MGTRPGIPKVWKTVAARSAEEPALGQVQDFRPVLPAHDRERDAADERRADSQPRVVLDHLDDLPEVEVGVLDHRRLAVLGGLHGLVVRLEEVGEVQDGAAVAAVQDAGELHPLRQGGHEELVDVVVLEEACALVIHGDEGFVLAVGLVAVVVPDRCAVAAVVEEQGITVRGPLHEPLHARDDVVHGRLVVLAVVEEEPHPIALAVALPAEVGLHGEHVVDAAGELAVRPDVVDANQEGAVVAAGLRVRNAEGRCQVHLPTRAEHRDLRVASGQDVAHGFQQLHPGVVVPLVERFEYGARAGAAGAAGARVVGQAEGGDVLDVRRGLLVHAAAEHDHRARHHLRRLRREGVPVGRGLAPAHAGQVTRVALVGPAALRGAALVSGGGLALGLGGGETELPRPRPDVLGHGLGRGVAGGLQQPLRFVRVAGLQDLGGPEAGRRGRLVLDLLADPLVEHPELDELAVEALDLLPALGAVVPRPVGGCASSRCQGKLSNHAGELGRVALHPGGRRACLAET
mmetsp:Transcript_30268/g.85361  ORF Transcript_30268/g.85361 Transcript_30268/m.85361 type:complete len:517 (-) Transcript_30268:16-1566(-)